ncbi:MAG: response regulator [Longimicrobiaceae bacterium]
MSRILFAEDDDALRRMTTQVLASAGHEVRDVPNGTAALDELRQRLPDLVVLDYRMGEPDGFEVCRRIKRDPAMAHVPVLILTAQRGIEDRLGGFDAGADDYLAKPFDPRELLARVAALLRLAQRGRDRNPTTGLPGGDAIYQELERRRQVDAPFAVADAAIREAAAALTTVARGRPDVFVGHVGGDDFVIICPPEDARRLAEDARRRFDTGLQRHLPPDAVSAGTYRGLDREGEEREFPLTRLSTAIVRIDPQRWPSMERLGEIVADAKRRAKGPEGGIAEADAEP